MQNLDVWGTIIANLALIYLLIGAWWVAIIWTAWDCLNRLEGIDRLTWLVATIAVPFGFIFYWIKGVDEGKENRRKYKGLEDL